MSKPRRARFIVGIDLGTTHTVVAYADSTESPVRAARDAEENVRPRPPIHVFRIPQLVAAGEVAERPLLPSFRYQPSEGELGEADMNVGWPDPLPELPRGVVGTFAQRLGGRVPGRLVSSAKSWLSHATVDRAAPILPWGAAEGVQKISPVDASASYLAHVRAAWDAAHPDHPLTEQEVVLTVPASFDEAARALTLAAAERAGIPKVRLLEEPQAAFYDWLDRHHDRLEEDLAGRHLTLVADVGGGTTDLTLIQVERRPSGPRLTRVAVGEHLMLGGDNMDLTLARQSEAALVGEGESMTAARFSQLVQQCREAKETLLSDEGPGEVQVSVLGGGAKLIGGTKSTRIDRARARDVVLEGFFPRVGPDARPAVRRGGLVEFGLPFVADPAITRHVAAFLSRHRMVAAEAMGIPLAEAEADPARIVPDAVLLNGGVFRAESLAARLLDVLGEWRGAEVTRLDNPEPDLAVARGAVAYGLARRGVGLRIGGGSARSYFMQVETGAETPEGVCLLPRGSEEGEEIELEGRAFALSVGTPVRFRLWASSSDTRYKPGELAALAGESFHELPAIAAVLEGKPGERGELIVCLRAALTEVGTLETSCVAVADPHRRYKLEFQLRGQAGSATSERAAKVGQLHPRFREATDLVQAFFGKGKKDLEGKKIKTLRGDLETILGDRQGWDSALLRELFGVLLAGARSRRRSADHERLWFHLVGYGLRPGFGYPLDEWRVQQVWALFDQGIEFASDAAVWSQWWILWRRIAGGLDPAAQARVLDDIAWYIEPQGRKPKPRPKGPRHLGLEDMVRLAGALERIPASRKIEVGTWLLERLALADVAPQAIFWSLGRLGARAPLHGSAHEVVPREVAAGWLERALREDLGKNDQAALCVAQLARRTQDRERDLEPTLRERAAAALAKAGSHPSWVTLIREGGELTAADEGRVFGESLPAGLRLAD